MAKQERTRFHTQGDWHNFINYHRQQQNPEVNLYDLRQQVYKEIEAIRDRPLFVYATKFLNPPPNNQFISIDLTDIDGFTDLVSSIDTSSDSVDIILHSPGGSPVATERIVNIIRNRFKEVAFLIPHSAYSAATMMALAGNEIILHPSATLGPIDPQLNGIPARAIIRGFENVRDLIKDEGPKVVPAYLPMLKKLTIEFLEQCKDAEDLSKILAKEWLNDYMFSDGSVSEKEIEELVEFLSQYDDHKIHSRPIFYDKLTKYKINVEKADGELALLMREAHILTNGFFELSSFVKIYENSDKLSYGKQVNAVNKSPSKSKEEN